jgi:CheY-like chemotaxis protein
MGANSDKKILVIDNATLERELLIEILKGSGVKNEFLQAKSGEEAIDVLGRHYKEIGLMLLDWEMPQMSGIEFMKGVVAVDAVKNIPIVMVTAAGSREDQELARKINPALAGYIVKPYEPEDLASAVRPYIK